MGDLAFLHDVGSLSLAGTAAERCVVVVVINNDGGAIFGQLPIAEHPAFERFFRAPMGGICTICAVSAFEPSGSRRLTTSEAALAGALTQRRFQVIEACVSPAASPPMYRAAAALAAELPEVAALAQWREPIGRPHRGA